MAKTKRSSKKLENGMSGIPENQRTAVGLVMGICAAEGRRVTPKAAYASLQKGNAKRLEQQAAKDREQKANAEEFRRERATQAIQKGVQNLALVRDLLTCLDSGQLEGSPMDPEAFITFARSTLVESVSTMEQALIDLDVLKVQFPNPTKIKTKGEGWFAEVIH